MERDKPFLLVAGLCEVVPSDSAAKMEASLICVGAMVPSVFTRSVGAEYLFKWSTLKITLSENSDYGPRRDQWKISESKHSCQNGYLVLVTIEVKLPSDTKTTLINLER